MQRRHGDRRPAIWRWGRSTVSLAGCMGPSRAARWWQPDLLHWAGVLVSRHDAVAPAVRRGVLDLLRVAHVGAALHGQVHLSGLEASALVCERQPATARSACLYL